MLYQLVFISNFPQNPNILSFIIKSVFNMFGYANTKCIFIYLVFQSKCWSPSLRNLSVGPEAILDVSIYQCLCVCVNVLCTVKC